MRKLLADLKNYWCEKENVEVLEERHISAQYTQFPFWRRMRRARGNVSTLFSLRFLRKCSLLSVVKALLMIKAK